MGGHNRDVEGATVVSRPVTGTGAEARSAGSPVATVHAVDVLTESAPSFASQVATALRLGEQHHSTPERLVAVYLSD